MELLYPLVSTLCLVALLGVVARVLLGRSPEAPRDRRSGTWDARFNEGLYLLFALILIATPALSFVVVTDLRIRPRGLGILTLFAGGAFLSLCVPLLVARLAGRDRLESFWCHLEARSKFNRKALTVFWLSVTAFVLTIGLAVSIISR
jgi:hypothetical protein